MATDKQTFSRAAAAALAGLVIQIVLSIAVALVGLWAHAPSVNFGASWYFIGGLPIWGVLWLVYSQHRVEVEESLEVEQLSKTSGQSPALFEQQADELNIARRRLANLYKWGLGGVSLVLAAYLLTLGTIFLVMAYKQVGSATFVADALGDAAQANPLILMALMVGVGFVGFAFARYAAGMTQVKEWLLLRGGAGYLMGNAVAAVFIAGASIFSIFANDTVLAWMGLVVPGLMLLVGLEIVLAFLTGAYRPRRPGEIPRPAFDTRILGWLTKPESLARIINETINYQFGFEVSSSWFYRLLSKAITPLIVAGFAILILISSVVIVQPEDQAIITTFGAIAPGSPAGPGLHFKWPWPVGRSTSYHVGRLQEVILGSYTDQPPTDRVILWTNQHSTTGKEEYLVTAFKFSDPSSNKGVPKAVPPAATQPGTVGGRSQTDPAVSLIAAQMYVQYKINDLLQFVTSSADPVKLLTAVSDQEVNAYFSRTELDRLMAQDRDRAGVELRRLIQARADARKMGVEVVFVGLTGVHPPQAEEVAEAFHEQVGALQEKETTIWKARQTSIQTLAEVAGSVDQAQSIAQEIRTFETLRAKLDAARTPPQGVTVKAADLAELSRLVTQQQAKVEAMVIAAPGLAGQAIYDARAYRWDVSIGELGRAQAFTAQLAASRNAPNYFRTRTFLDALAQGLVKPRKYVVGSDAQLPGVFRIDLKDSGSALTGLLNPTP